MFVNLPLFVSNPDLRRKYLISTRNWMLFPGLLSGERFFSRTFHHFAFTVLYKCLFLGSVMFCSCLLMFRGQRANKTQSLVATMPRLGSDTQLDTRPVRGTVPPVAARAGLRRRPRRGDTGTRWGQHNEPWMFGWLEDPGKPRPWFTQ